jgi:rare lipoprotein A
MLLLAACGSTPDAPVRPERPSRDGPHPNPPADLHRVPDARPRVEPLRIGGPNKPYEALGRRYVPMTEDLPLQESGLASWYGIKFHGRPTSSGEPYDMFAMTAAHRTMPIPSYARVRNPANGREVVVRINDRGPFAEGRVIDLSYTAALRLGVLGGVAPVQVRRLTHSDIRAIEALGSVRDGRDPDRDPLAEFVRRLPEP